MKSSRVLLVLVAAVMAGLALVLLVSAGRAAEEAATGPHPAFVTLAVDTTAGMDEEVSALTAAWNQVFPPASSQNAPGRAAADHCDEWYRCHYLTETFKLITFRDELTVLGESSNSGEVNVWLSSLATDGDGNCLDNGLGALRAAAHLAPNSHFTNTDALLLTDSAPRGGRTALARTINMLARQRVAVNAAATGWCQGARLSPQALGYLAAGTGGPPPAFFHGSYTATLRILLGDMATPDTLLARMGGGLSFEDVYSFEVDSSVTLLDIALVEESDPCHNAYFATLCARLESGVSAPGSAQMVVRDPAGNVVTQASAGVRLMEAEGITYLQIDTAAYPGPGTGAFQVDISGVDAGYALRASASSEVVLTRLSPPLLPAGQPGRVVVGLLLPAVQRAGEATLPTEELFGAYNLLTGETVPLALKDDGLSGDGRAGDHVYGGTWEPAPGLWQVRAYGQLADGSRYERVIAAPIRVQRFRLAGPGENEVMPGDNVRQAFSLSNEDSVSQTFELEVVSEQGWALTGTVPASVTLGAGETVAIEVGVAVPAGTRAGTIEETSLTAVAQGDNPLDSTTATARTRAVDMLTVHLPLVRR